MNQVSYQSSIPGSKPKKLITRTILTNPSLISVSMTSLLNPQNPNLSKIYEAIQTRKNLLENHQKIAEKPANQMLKTSSYKEDYSYVRSSMPKLDSLEVARNQFESQKINKNVERAEEKMPVPKSRAIEKQLSYMSRRSSEPSLLLRSLSYQNSEQIRSKQTKAYNIISNMQI